MRLDRKKLVYLRVDKKLTQKQAAKRAGVSLPTYNSAEAGNDIQPLKAGRIAEFYRVDLSDLEAEPQAQTA